MGRPRTTAQVWSLALAIVVALPWPPMLAAVEALRDAPPAASRTPMGGPESRRIQKDDRPDNPDLANGPAVADDFDDDDDERAGDEGGAPAFFCTLTPPPGSASAVPSASRCLPFATRSPSSPTVPPVHLRC